MDGSRAEGGVPALSDIGKPMRTGARERDPIVPSRFDIRRWRRFWMLAGPYWRSEERWRAGVLLALLAVLLLGQTGFNVAFVELSGELTSALAARDGERFWSAIRGSVVVLLIAVPIWALYYYVRDTLGIHWRRWLTHHLLDAYLANRAYYALNARGDIDNPDQRIAEDAATFTQQSLYFLMVALGATIQLVAFTSVLWSISHELVYFLVGYALFGTIVTTAVFGRTLVGLNFRQLRREADFRFGLVRIREHAEAIAFLRGEADESTQAKLRFESVFGNFRRLIRTQFGLNLFQYAFSFLTIVLPSAIIASRVLSGELEVGRAVQAGGAFTAILAAMTVVVDHFESLSRLSAGVDRLHGFVQTLDAQRPDAPPRPGGSIETASGPRIVLERLTVRTPGHERTLVSDLSVTVDPGHGLLIVGDSGGGKSSLLRAIGGLWTAGDGRIECPPAAHMMFLPQQPYMILGSLRSQLLYPDRTRSVDDAALSRLLEQVNLGETIGRFGGLDAERDWAKVLSIGEQQRLAFARVLLAEPHYVMLDEATSALDASNEENLYRQLAATRTTPVSVSHRPGVLPFHDQVLELPGGGQWRLLPAEGYRFD
jgi:vitamin B12/bleomycin/antimicrobial peptide transport system ATP-binding/permease protein